MPKSPRTNKSLIVLKKDIAKKMMAPQSYLKTPPYMPGKNKGVKQVVGYKHGPSLKNLTAQKNKRFTKNSSNGPTQKLSSPPGWENR